MKNTTIFQEIAAERKRQDQKWGFPQDASPMEWGSILAEECGELCQALNDYQQGCGCFSRIYDEAVQVAAVVVAIIRHRPFFERCYAPIPFAVSQMPLKE